MAPPSSSPEPARLSRFGGPALAIIGAAAIALIVLPPAAAESPLAWWIVNSALTPERLLPLLGFGAALTLVRPRSALAALLLFSVGIAFGFVEHKELLDPLTKMPQAATQHFLTGPIASIAVGLALIPPARWRAAVLPLSALVAGCMLALAIVVTDPTLNDPTNRIAGVTIGFWVVVVIMLTLRAFHRPWFAVFSRILGSWLIAIGLLYGAVALMPRKAPPPPPPIPDLNPLPDLERSRPGTLPQ